MCRPGPGYSQASLPRLVSVTPKGAAAFQERLGVTAE